MCACVCAWDGRFAGFASFGPTVKMILPMHFCKTGSQVEAIGVHSPPICIWRVTPHTFRIASPDLQPLTSSPEATTLQCCGHTAEPIDCLSVCVEVRVESRCHVFFRIDTADTERERILWPLTMTSSASSYTHLQLQITYWMVVFAMLSQNYSSEIGYSVLCLLWLSATQREHILMLQ